MLTGVGIFEPEFVEGVRSCLMTCVVWIGECSGGGQLFML